MTRAAPIGPLFGPAMRRGDWREAAECNAQGEGGNAQARCECRDASCRVGVDSRVLILSRAEGPIPLEATIVTPVRAGQARGACSVEVLTRPSGT